MSALDLEGPRTASPLAVLCLCAVPTTAVVRAGRALAGESPCARRYGRRSIPARSARGSRPVSGVAAGVSTARRVRPDPVAVEQSVLPDRGGAAFVLPQVVACGQPGTSGDPVTRDRFRERTRTDATESGRRGRGGPGRAARDARLRRPAPSTNRRGQRSRRRLRARRMKHGGGRAAGLGSASPRTGRPRE